MLPQADVNTSGKAKSLGILFHLKVLTGRPVACQTNRHTTTHLPWASLRRRGIQSSLQILKTSCNRADPPDRRAKLSGDPNNTAWSKSTSTFGHRILTAQGWRPGQYLGAADAGHAAHYSAASASHIRVALREDNLGLGAARRGGGAGGGGTAETFGLSTLAGIFGRLNGESGEELQRREDAIRDVELRAFQSRRFGSMTFVRGGLLVGDEMRVPEDAAGVAEEAAGLRSAAREEKSVKAKRKRVEEAPAEATEPRKKAKSSRRNRADSGEEGVKAGRAKKRRAPTGDSTVNGPDELKANASPLSVPQRSTGVSTEGGNTVAEGKAAKALRKEERRARKEERRRRKEERLLRTTGTGAPSETSALSAAPLPTAQLDRQRDGPPDTSNTGPSTFSGSRHAVRQRYIQQKRMASMDARALNEILMIKAVAG